MFKMKKEIVNEVGLHSQSLTDLEGCSAAYLGSIKATVDDLKATNNVIQGRQAIVSDLIKELQTIEKGLNELKASNESKIEALEVVFGIK